MEWVPILLQTLAPSGAVVWAVKLALNGTRQKVGDVYDIVSDVRSDIRIVKSDIGELKETDHTLDKRVSLLESVKG